MWCLLLLLAADSSDQWGARVETASVRVRTQASLLAQTAGGIAAAGRAQSFGPLRSDVDELVRQAEQLEKWANEPAPVPEADGKKPPR